MKESRLSHPDIADFRSRGVVDFEPATITKASSSAWFTDSQRGFSLIEIMVAMVIIGIVAAVSVVAMADALDRARQRATVADMRALAKAIESYAVDYNDPPTSNGDINSLVQTLDLYSRSLPPTDHWGNTYEYARDAAGNYTLQSLGKDGVDGDDVSPETSNEYHRDIVINNGIFVATTD